MRERNALADTFRDHLESLNAYAPYNVQWHGGEVSATRGRWHLHPCYVRGLLLEERSQDVLYDLAHPIVREWLDGME